MGHTPGPWEVCRNWVCEKNDPGHNVGICIVEDRPDKDSNARLIAAAPDLLEALELIDTGDEDPASRIARKAIAKAKQGEE